MIAMESASLRHTIVATSNSRSSSSFQKRRNNPRTSLYRHSQRFLFRNIKNYKQSAYQDFQGYVKPSRLLPTTGLKVCTEKSDERVVSFLSERESQSLFKVKLQTSNVYGSGLSDQNAGIYLCLIDTNGDSILQRIPVILKPNSAESLDMAQSISPLHFQRGSVDEFIFAGPKLGVLEAIWLGVESGQWRLSGVSLTVINAHQPFPEENDEQKNRFSGLLYEFAVDDILLGEGSDISMLELRPCLVTELSSIDPSNALSKSSSESTPPLDAMISKEQSMREYADLKLSLLSYDATLVFFGTAIANLSAGESAALAFFAGGIGGFLYLLLLQRSVDELPSLPPSNNAAGLFQGVKGPVWSLALAIGLSFAAVKYRGGQIGLMFGAKELLVGMMGFLACKVAVVLAAFKPIKLDY